MQVLEDRVPVRSGEVVDCRDCALAVVGAIHAPGREQRCGQIGDRSADRLREVAARSRILLVLERAHAEHQPRDAIVLVDLGHAIGEFDRLVDVAVDQEGQEGAVEQLAIVRIALERRAVIGGRGRGIALLAGMTRGEITARGGHAARGPCGLVACAASLMGLPRERRQARCRQCSGRSSKTSRAMLQ